MNCPFKYSYIKKSKGLITFIFIPFQEIQNPLNEFNDCIWEYAVQFKISRQIIVVSLKDSHMNQNQTPPRPDTPESDKTKVASPAQQPQQPSKAEPLSTPENK
jgi:hypothetical protein